ncbi:MFS transporter [Brassicibacter mesophilus]|uniref:MFS transporter n=1 Tax=Brassicibacter mesophilus TaxID=745119 RepID=UPI003D2502B2
MFKVNKEEKSWILYDWANSAYTLTITSTILPLYFKAAAESAGIAASTSTAYWGYANSISTLILSLLAPILGTIADYRNYKKKFFTFFLFTGVFFTVMYSFVPQSQWIWLLALYIITAIGFSGANIFYDSFLVDVTTNDRMDRISTSGFAFGYIGSTIPFIICIAIILLSQKEILPISYISACKISFIITAIWWFTFSLPFLKNVKQKHYVEPEPNPVLNSFKRLFKTLKNIKSHKKLFIFLLAYFFYIDGVGTIIKMATSYGSDLGVSPTSLLIILLVTQFVAFPCALLYGKLSQRFSTKKLIYFAIIIYIGICIYAYFLKTTLDFWILAMLVGTSQGGIQALSRSYYAKLVPKENSNEFFGFYNIFGKFAAIFGPFLVGIVAQMTGKTNNGVFSIIILFIIGGILLARTPE